MPRLLAVVSSCLLGPSLLCAAQPAASEVPVPAGKSESGEPLTPLGHVEVRGTGTVVLILIPGLACDWTVFESFMERNSAKYTMYAVTLPGFGDIPPPPIAEWCKPSEGAWLENAERAVVQLVNDRKLDKPFVVGHSLGGHIAVRLATGHGELFRGCVSLDGAPAILLGDPSQKLSSEARREVIDTAAWQQYQGVTDADWGSLVRQMAQNDVRDPERAAKIGDLMAGSPRDSAIRYLAEFMASDLTEDLLNLECRLLMVAAIPEQERAGVPINAFRQYYSEMFAPCPLASLTLFEETLHFVTEDAPEELDRAVAAFVADEPVPGKPIRPKPAEPAAAGPQIPSGGGGQ